MSGTRFLGQPRSHERATVPFAPEYRVKPSSEERAPRGSSPHTLLSLGLAPVEGNGAGPAALGDGPGR